MIPKIALFRLSRHEYALPVEGILHILSSPKVFPLPLLPSGVQGVFLYKGEAVPLVDPYLAGAKAHAKGDDQFVIVYGTESGLVGLQAEQVLQIVDRGQGTFEKIDALEEIRGADLQFVHRNRKYPVLNVETLVASLAQYPGSVRSGRDKSVSAWPE